MFSRHQPFSVDWVCFRPSVSLFVVCLSVCLTSCLFIRPFFHSFVCLLVRSFVLLSFFPRSLLLFVCFVGGPFVYSFCLIVFVCLFLVIPCLVWLIDQLF